MWRAAELPEPALPPGADEPEPEAQGGTVGVRGAPPPPWLEPGAALLLLTRALLPTPAPSRADEVHAGLLRGAAGASGARDGLGADEGPLLAAGAA